MCLLPINKNIFLYYFLPIPTFTNVAWTTKVYRGERHFFMKNRKNTYITNITTAELISRRIYIASSAPDNVWVGGGE